MGLKLNATNGGGSVELDVPNTVNSDLALTVPATAGEIVVKATDNSVDLGDVNIDSSGNVGIGTSSPGTSLEIDSTTPYITLKNSTEEDTDGGRESKLIFEGEQSGGEISTLAEIQASHDGTSDDQKGDLVFRTNGGSDNAAPTERMRIGSDGKAFFSFGLGYPRGADVGIKLSDWRLYNTTANEFVIDNYSVGVKINNNATSWTTFSDERQKTNLAPITDGLSKVATLRALTGRYLVDDEDVSRAFLIAQDVQAVLPEAVSIDDNEDGTLGLRYTEVIPLLVSALKESKERIEALETKVAALEGGQS